MVNGNPLGAKMIQLMTQEGRDLYEISQLCASFKPDLQCREESYLLYLVD
jgi:hypothetical protein